MYPRLAVVLTARNHGMDTAHQLRRSLKRRGMKPRNVWEIMEPLGKAQFKPVAQEKLVNLGTAKCKRYAGRTIVVGRTPFKFDSDGTCKAKFEPGRGSLVDDWKALLATNGVTQVEEAAAPEAETVKMAAIVPPPPAAPARKATVPFPPEPPPPGPVATDTAWSTPNLSELPAPPEDLVAASEADADDGGETMNDLPASGSETDDTTARRRRRGKK